MVVFTWCLTGISIVGVIMNIQKRRESFLIWMFTNACWAAVDFYKGIPAQATLFLIYFGLAIWGYHAWGKNDTSAPAATNG